MVDKNLDTKQIKTQHNERHLHGLSWLRRLRKNMSPKATTRSRMKMASSTTTITTKLGLLACTSSAKGCSVTVFPDVTP